MFTGIITHLGSLKKKENSILSFGAPKSFLKELQNGSSVAVNGVCLTVFDKNTNNFSVEVMPETIRKTMLDDLLSGAEVNLELPMRVNDRFEGHIVQGHVDGVGKIISINAEGNSHLFRFKTSKKLCSSVVSKGSIAINGISLTVIEVGIDWFTVGIIPYTMIHTMLSHVKVGDSVNIETDILLKYMQQLLQKKGREKI